MEFELGLVMWLTSRDGWKTAMILSSLINSFIWRDLPLR